MKKELSFLSAKETNTHRFDDTEKEAVNRTKFVRDRDRILFSKEFRRLQGKTQVFINGFDDHVRNRLTHTIEVSQIAQTIVDHFGFNRYLSEAVSLGHDVGHTPFGHTGERVLNHFTNNCDSFKGFKITDKSKQGFKHNWQGIKVVSTLEKISPDFSGLNLTDYTIWGILNHSDLNYKACKKINNGICQYNHSREKCLVEDQTFSLGYYTKYEELYNKGSWTFESLIVSIADEIAQRHHDIEDGIIAGIIDKNEMIESFENEFVNNISDSQKVQLNHIKNTSISNFAIHDISSIILSFYSKKLIENTTQNIHEFVVSNNINTEEQFNQFKLNAPLDFDPIKLVTFSDEFTKKDKSFKKYLVNRVLNSHLAQTMDGKANHIIRIIIESYLTNPKQLPDGTIITLLENYYISIKNIDKMPKNENLKLLSGIVRAEVDSLHNSNNNEFRTVLIRTITDFIAGMTDKYAISQYRMLYGSDNYWMK